MLEVAEHTGQATPPKKNILVVDDDHYVADSVCALLEMYGVKAHVAHSLEEACDIAVKVMPDFVVLDLQLGDGSGYDVVRFLRARLGFEQTRIVAHSGLSSEMHKPLSKEKGFDNFVMKGAPAHELLEALDISPARVD